MILFKCIAELGSFGITLFTLYYYVCQGDMKYESLNCMDLKICSFKLKFFLNSKHEVFIYNVLFDEDLVLTKLNWSRCWNCSWQCKISFTMSLDSKISSPHRRSQIQTAFSVSSPSLKRQNSRSDEHELGGCSALLQRHRFLLTALGLLAFLCTIYLYFAVTLGPSDTCSGFTGAEKAACHLEHGKAFAKGKLKFF